MLEMQPDYTGFDDEPNMTEYQAIYVRLFYMLAGCSNDNGTIPISDTIALFHGLKNETVGTILDINTTLGDMCSLYDFINIIQTMTQPLIEHRATLQAKTT